MFEPKMIYNIAEVFLFSYLRKFVILDVERNYNYILPLGLFVDLGRHIYLLFEA